MPYLVSIITPLHNSAQYIAETIDSVMAQTYTHWELIIVDDCSEDNSFEIAQDYARKDARIKLLRLTQNSGAAVARNTAIEKAEGRFIAFLDSDDQWKPQKLEKQLSFMIANNHAFAFTAYEKMDEKGKPAGSIDVPLSVSYKDLLRTCSIGCLTVIYDTHLLGKVFMPLIEKRQDYGLWLKILKTIPKAYGMQEKLALYRVRSNSLSGNKINAARYQWKVYREVEKLNLFKSSYYFTNYFLHGFIKTFLK
ncbi:MAG: glycosyltransferase family 2 protein [Bacteroidales bacterium]